MVKFFLKLQNYDKIKITHTISNLNTGLNKYLEKPGLELPSGRSCQTRYV